MILDRFGNELRRKIGFEGGLSSQDRHKVDLISTTTIEPVEEDGEEAKGEESV